jgi:DNA repair exonuclease SbcCD ATPase subunit
VNDLSFNLLEQILSELAQTNAKVDRVLQGQNSLQQGQNHMTDILDQELKALSDLTTELNKVATDVATLIADFQATPGGTISVTDSRWQTLTDAFASLQSSAQALDSQIQAVLPPPAPASSASSSSSSSKPPGSSSKPIV